MGVVVVSGASCSCPFGTAVCTLQVTSQLNCMADGKPIATIQDVQPGTNLATFGMCSSLANPAVAAATAAAGSAGFHDLGIKNKRIHRFQNSNRQIGGSGAFSAAGHRAEAGAGAVALKHADVSFTAKQNHFLLYHAHAAELLNIPGRNACLAADLAVDADADLIESPIEGHCIDIHIRPQNVGALDADSAGVIDNLLTVFRQIHTDILVAIFVTTGIQNTVCIDTHHFFSVRRTHSVFSHETFTSVII